MMTTKGHKWGHRYTRAVLALGTILAIALAGGAHYRLGSH